MKGRKFNIGKYPKTFTYVLENDTFTKRCNRCGSVVLRETVKMDDDYPYQCLSCNENMFEFETHEGDYHTDKELDNLCCYTRDILQLDN